MLAQYLFAITFMISPLPPLLKGNPDPPPSGNPTLINFFTPSEQDLISIDTPHRKTYGPLTLQEKAALNNLKNNQWIAIKPCDKGGGICIMNTRHYVTKAHTYLQDHNSAIVSVQ